MVNRDASIVIIGGGPAGLTAALALQRQSPRLSARVIVLEKGRYPREKYCAGALGGRGEQLLRGLDALPDVPAVEIHGMSLATGEGRVSVDLRQRIGSVVRRCEFDAALARIAIDRGIRILDGTTVTAVRPGARPGAPAEIETTAGSFEASTVVGADGVGSVVRRAMKLGPERFRAQAVEVDTERVAADPERPILHFDASDRALNGYSWSFPTEVLGKAMVCRGTYQLRTATHPFEGLDEHFSSYLRTIGLDARSYKKKRYSERGRDASGPLSSPSMILIGEAAGIDPITGEGIAQAIEYGALCARFLVQVDAGDARLAGWDAVVHGSRLGRDLRVRAALASLLYGPNRIAYEGALTYRPELVSAGCRHFGGFEPRKRELARGVCFGGFAWARRTLPRTVRGAAEAMRAL